MLHTCIPAPTLTNLQLYIAIYVRFPELCIFLLCRSNKLLSHLTIPVPIATALYICTNKSTEYYALEVHFAGSVQLQA